MKNTRLMEVLFSAVEENDEELTNQVANDIEDAKKNGVVDTDEVTYENAGDGKVAITDKGTGEVTVAEKAEDEDGTYDLYPAEMTEQIEGFIHPEDDGVTPGRQRGEDDERVEYHMTGEDVISPNLEDGGLNPNAGYEQSIEDLAYNGCDNCEDEREFSVSTDNEVVSRIFSDQEFCEKIFAEVIDSEETAKVGDLKVEKLPDEENTVVVTNETTGDQAKVTMDDDEMEVTELESKGFSEDEQYLPLHVVGIDVDNHTIIDATEYDEDSAEDLVDRLEEQGISGLKVIEDAEDARDYAIQLLDNVGVEDSEDVDEPVQAEFSDHTIYLTNYYSDTNSYMCRLFSESVDDINSSQDEIEDAIESGEEIENNTEIITPVDKSTAVIEDKGTGELTKAELEEEELNLTPISKEEADELTDHIAVEDDDEDDDEDDEDDEKNFSDYYDEYDERYYSDYDDDYDERYYSDYDDYDERYYSDYDEDIYCDDTETKFFSESEADYMTDYMTRLFSDEADSEEIEDAIENGEQVENDDEIITPIDKTTAVIEDKETGEFTKAEMDDETLDVNPISEEEADELTDHIAVEDDDDDDNEDEKEFSYVEDPIMDKFFSEVMASAPQQTQQNVASFFVDEQGNPIAPADQDPQQGQGQDPNAQQMAAQGGMPEGGVDGATSAPSVESVEDKALAAVQSIQAAASEAEAAIMNAKAAPVEGEQADLQEAQFSEYYDYDDYGYQGGDTLLTWLNGNNIYRR